MQRFSLCVLTTFTSNQPRKQKKYYPKKSFHHTILWSL